MIAPSYLTYYVVMISLINISWTQTQSIPSVTATCSVTHYYAPESFTTSTALTTYSTLIPTTPFVSMTISNPLINTSSPLHLATDSYTN